MRLYTACQLCSSEDCGQCQAGVKLTYAEHLEVGRAPRRAIDPRELNWLPARDSRVVVAGIVLGCRALRFYSKRRDMGKTSLSGEGDRQTEVSELEAQALSGQGWRRWKTVQRKV